MWPNLIVGVNGDPAGLVLYSDGTSGRFEGHEGCPTEFDLSRYGCAFSLYLTPADYVTTLTMSRGGADLGQVTVPLSAFNRCGHDVAYLEFDVATNAWSDTQYLNPCSTFH